MPRILETIGDFDIEVCYSLRALARLVGWNHQKLKRTLDKGEVFPQDGKYWMSDIRDNMSYFYESMVEVIKFRQHKGRILEPEKPQKTLFEQELEHLM
jgi:hypothetical protein